MQTTGDILIADRYLLQGSPAVRSEVATFAAFDQLLGRAVAVQLLTTRGAADADLSRIFLRHQQIASAVHNCPLLTVYDAGVWEGRPFSVRECDKGFAPASLHRQGYPPDLAVVLGSARQSAEALACLREAGLSDWVFAPGAVQVDGRGNAHVAVMEGLGGEGSSGSVSTDGSALRTTLSLMLTGKAAPTESDLRSAFVPAALIAVLGDARGDTTARQFQQRLAGIEIRANSDTQAYLPPGGSLPPQSSVLPRTGPVHPSEVPTMAAPLPLSQGASPQTTAALPVVPEAGQPYMPPINEVALQASRRDWKPLVLVAVLLLGAILLVAAFRLLGAQNRTNVAASVATAQPVSAASPTSQPVPALVAAPDMRGTSLDEAAAVAQGLGLTTQGVDKLYDSNIEAGRVSRQNPPPGTQLQPGSVVNLSVSLGPQPAPTSTSPPAPPNPPVQENPTAPPHTEPAPPRVDPPSKDPKGGKGGNGKKDSDK